MPEICRFLGISFYMYFNDHNPPHFHVKYNEFRAIVSINSLEVIGGNLPPRILGLVVEWAGLYKEELIMNWKTLQKTGEFVRIDPLV